VTYFIKCLNKTLVMPNVLGPDVLRKLIHRDIFHKVFKQNLSHAWCPRTRYFGEINTPWHLL